ncbi:MAG: ABC transporter substrate-binding protein [Clostridiales bacterium]|nr:ABC transporter substrate-binding protein [Clostridiales bacterium]
MFRKSMVLALALALALSCAAAAAGFPVTLVDGGGREVTLDSQPQKIVSLSPSNTEILFALGVGDRVIGVDAVSNHPPEVAGIDIVGDYSGPNVELILSLAPDVIFASNHLQADAIAQLTSLGAQVISVEAAAYDAIPASIQLIADAVGADAQPVLDAMAAKQAEVLANQPVASPKIYFALSFGEGGDWTAGPGTFIDDMIAMAGGVNVAASAGAPWAQYSLEQLIADDPDVILISSYADGLVEQFSAAEGYRELRAVKEGHVYAINADTSSRPAPRIVEALSDISAAVHQAAAR